MWEAFEAFGLQAYSRYDIDTMNAENIAWEEADEDAEDVDVFSERCSVDGEVI